MSFLRKPSDSYPPAIFPTFLHPSLPFRRKSRQSSTDSAVSSVSVFSTVSIASTNSSNPFSRSPTPIPIPTQIEVEIVPPTDKLLTGHNSHIHCAKCNTDLCLTAQIISKGFTGRHGRAFLVQGGPVPGKGAHSTSSVLPNTFLGKPTPRNLVTGQHTVCDVSCTICGSLLGWKYVEANEISQKYKVGKFILETKKIRVGVSWEDDESEEEVTVYDNVRPLTHEQLKKLNDSAAAGKDPLEFDSQDEDECEDLFAGVWSVALAKKRRQRKRERERKGRFIPPKTSVSSIRSSQESLA